MGAAGALPQLGARVSGRVGRNRFRCLNINEEVSLHCDSFFTETKG